MRPLAYPMDSLFRRIVWRNAGGEVYSGPFKGLRLAPRPFLPHLLGCYELELHEIVDSLCDRDWKRIVNVGGGNGFYVAGLGRRVPHAELIVFEMSAEARVVIDATLERNGLAARTRVLGTADPENLEEALAGSGPTLVVMDVEGAEVELTNPNVIPSLRNATILVETHDVIRSGCRDRVTAQLAASHTVTVLSVRPRTIDDFPRALSPMLQRIAPRRCVEAVQEWRGGAQDWLLLEPRVTQ